MNPESYSDQNAPEGKDPDDDTPAIRHEIATEFPELDAREREMVVALHLLARAATLGVNTDREEMLKSDSADLEHAIRSLNPTLVEARTLFEESGILKKLSTSQKKRMREFMEVRFKEEPK